MGRLERRTQGSEGGTHDASEDREMKMKNRIKKQRLGLPISPPMTVYLSVFSTIFSSSFRLLRGCHGRQKIVNHIMCFDNILPGSEKKQKPASRVLTAFALTSSTAIVVKLETVNAVLLCQGAVG